jgi:ABC-2 type transport system ATP-binding protein
MSEPRIVFDNVSRFYGEVLGVNRVNLAIPPGITSLVGPNGSGKTTLMNLMTGLIRPSRGTISVLGFPDRSRRAVPQDGLLHAIRLVPQGPHGLRVRVFVTCVLRHAPNAEADKLTWEAIERVSMTRGGRAAPSPATARACGSASNWRRPSRTDPSVLVLDEPLNGLDRMARAETIALFKHWAEEGRTSSSPVTFCTRWTAFPTR